MIEMTSKGGFNEIKCNEFEDLLTDYLDGTLEKPVRRTMAEHTLKCPVCHELLNEVKNTLQACHEISVPKTLMTQLEARILAMTMPETAMNCEDFEDYLTDYLDGFLPANLFHRWERHAVLCEKCTDLPGEVVRSIAACYTYKNDELPIPSGLHERILQATLGTVKASALKPSVWKQIIEAIRSFLSPISIPQLAPVAMMLLIAFFVLTQTVSSDGSLTGIYEKSFQLAEQTYLQSADSLGLARNQTPNLNQPLPQEGN
jgi:anti-sigma factor RsiW